MSTSKIKLLVDTVSPFGYIAYWILRNDPVFKKVDIEYVPIFLGGIMKACGNTAPINIKNKDKWIGLERLRWARLFNVPMKQEMPPQFPPPTLGIMRAMCALTVLYPGQEGQDILIKCLDRLFEAYWAEHVRTFDKDVLPGILKHILGEEEGGKVLAMAAKEGKEILTRNSDQAVNEGTFGLPWFVVTNSKGETENFWGVDHLGMVVAHLEIEKPRMGGGWKASL